MVCATIMTLTKNRLAYLPTVSILALADNNSAKSKPLRAICWFSAGQKKLQVRAAFRGGESQVCRGALQNSPSLVEALLGGKNLQLNEPAYVGHLVQADFQIKPFLICPENPPD